MKSLVEFLCESTQSEDLHEEVGRALRKFGTIRNGFKMANIDDIKDAMYAIEFDFDEENSDDEHLTFVGNYIDTQYEVTIYFEDHVKGKGKIKNFNVMES